MYYFVAIEYILLTINDANSSEFCRTVYQNFIFLIYFFLNFISGE